MIYNLMILHLAVINHITVGAIDLFSHIIIIIITIKKMKSLLSSEQ